MNPSFYSILFMVKRIICRTNEKRVMTVIIIIIISVCSSSTSSWRYAIFVKHAAYYYYYYYWNGGNPACRSVLVGVVGIPSMPRDRRFMSRAMTCMRYIP